MYRVALFDSGVNEPTREASDLQWGDFLSMVSRPASQDDLGHGTQWTQAFERVREEIQAGDDHAVELSIIKIFGTSRRASRDVLSRAFRALSSLKHKPDLLALPWGTRYRKSVSPLTSLATDPEVCLLAAAGNPSAGMEKPLFPACLEEVRSVGVCRDRWLYDRWDAPPDHVVDCTETSIGVAEVAARLATEEH